MAGQCIIDSDCPAECTCEGTVVDCSRKGLTQISRQLPMYTTELRMNGNKITEISLDVMEKLINLEKLNLSDNFLSRVEAGAFQGAKKLRDL